jgi:hypothetical protein
MAQIFKPGANTIARTVVYGALPFLVVAWWIGYELYDSSYVNRVGIVRGQPVPFSHEHHVRELGIDCRYCHVSVEKSSFAGLPSSRTCMTCHSQVWKDAPMLEPVRESFRTGEPIKWTRVTKVPDFVYFDHSIHLAKGLACADCHGRVDEMPLTYKTVAFRMKDCLQCHRDGHPVVADTALDKYLAAIPAVTHPLMVRSSEEKLTKLVLARGVTRLQDCYTCHR